MYLNYEIGGLGLEVDWTLLFVLVTVWLGYLVYACNKRPKELGTLGVMITSIGVLVLTWLTFVSHWFRHAVMALLSGLGVNAIGFLQFSPVIGWGVPLTGKNEPWMWFANGVSGPFATFIFGFALLFLGILIRWPTIRRMFLYSGMFGLSLATIYSLPVGDSDGGLALSALFMIAGWWRESSVLWGTSLVGLLAIFLCMAFGLSLLTRHRDYVQEK